MNTLPLIINILFVATTLLTVLLFYKASGNAKIVLWIIVAWTLLQSVISITGFYQVTASFPPRLFWLVGPGILLTIILFTTQKGKAFVDSLNLKYITLLHSVRVPVEITLYYVYLSGLIPKIMTFEGNNLDIVSGVTAFVMFFFVFQYRRFNVKALLIWNFVCLGLLLNILAIAILAAKTPFQKLAFDQPNIGVTIFPIVWLPGVIVPLVLISHLASIRQLLKPNASSYIYSI